MIVKSIAYERVYSLGNYENEKIRMEAAISETEDPAQAYNALKATVEHAHHFSQELPKYEQYKEKLADVLNITPAQHAAATRYVDDFERRYASFLGNDVPLSITQGGGQKEEEY